MSKKKKKEEMTYAERLLHIPNPMHLEACKAGGRIYRDRTKYTRKGKDRWDARKENY